MYYYMDLRPESRSQSLSRDVVSFFFVFFFLKFKRLKSSSKSGSTSHLHHITITKHKPASLIHILDGDATLSKEEEDQIRKTLSFVIVGGGPTGVEFAGELTDFLFNEISKTYPHLKDFWSCKLIGLVFVIRIF